MSVTKAHVIGGNMNTKRWILALSFVLLFLGGCSQMSSPLKLTGYNETSDLYVVFHGRHFANAGRFLPVGLLGELLFDLQEGTHNSITNVSGAEVDHYYIWVCLADQCIPVDPFTFSS